MSLFSTISTALIKPLSDPLIDRLWPDIETGRIKIATRDLAVHVILGVTVAVFKLAVATSSPLIATAVTVMGVYCTIQSIRLAITINTLRVDSVKRRTAAIKIQNACRGYVARIKSKKLQAAIKLQSVWRGRSGRFEATRAKRFLLNHDLFERSKHYIDTPGALSDIPRASCGRSPVFLPTELPLALKGCGHERSLDRLVKMQQALELCTNSGYERLVVPQARVYKGFVIETRLPFVSVGTKEQIGLYVENYHCFTQAAKEFTAFLCQSSLGDITGTTADPFKAKARYDNVPLYLENGIGNLGLIDLDYFSLGIPKHYAIHEMHKHYYCACIEAVEFFPFHLDDIMDAAKAFDPNIETYRNELVSIRDRTLDRFRFIYLDHLSFVKEKNISLNNPSQLVEISPIRQEEIQNAILLKLHQAHSGGLVQYGFIGYEGGLGDQPEELLTLVKQSLHTILGLTTNFLLEISIKLKKTKNISSFDELLSHRSLRYDVGCSIYKKLEENVALALHMIKDNEETFFYKEHWASLVIRTVFQEMVKGRELAYYNPFFVGNSEQCIFY